MATPATYPPARERLREAEPRVSEKFERYETLEATFTAQTPPTTLGCFSGRPDAIDLISTTADVFFTLTDELGREESTLFVAAGVRYETHISKRCVLAARAVAGAATTARAVGKWAARGE